MQTNPPLIQIDASTQRYYNAKDLCEYSPAYFYGCTVKRRNIIQKKKIPETDIVFANFSKKNEWKISNIDCKQAQLLLTFEWAHAHFFPTTKQHIKSFIELETEPLHTEVSVETKDAPPILELEEHEKFKDESGKVLTIEVRGERTRHQIWFDVFDISAAFDIPNLSKTLHDKYERTLHYECFVRLGVTNSYSQSNRKIEKFLCLTYKGLLKVLYNSRSGTAEKFQDWVEDNMFAIQLGTVEQKEELGTSILGITIKNFKAVFDKCSFEMPCIYLLSFGTVGVLRKTFGIKDEISDQLIVYKYGFTKDLPRRLSEHQSTYGKKENVNVKVEMWTYIDPKYTSEAEGNIRDIVESFEKALDINTYKELIVLNPKEFERMKKEYTRTGREYAGASQQLQDQIAELNNELKMIKVELTSIHQVQALEIQNRDKDVEKFKTEVNTNQRMYELELKHRDQLVDQYKNEMKLHERIHAFELQRLSKIDL